ncbi:sigma 54-interacting transcriptional regulator [Thermoflavimicrobium daqui]|uniref:Sigma-54-dependent Fis family transcriptional regulator n=1 Tax=Thermoflavimicrobium daqui TaxID=2137476 RepID=A0A364K8B5_9BACL|nr:sigma 54-interacting transcriptional regulator [Thermoflavimicrobium daqui]RAL26546.1 sigma-54-dependent Fis family transcriptional regulator [Thermoflavimicrobium daqui]
MQKILMIGGGQNGAVLLRMLLTIKEVQVLGVIDHQKDAPAIQEASRQKIATGTDLLSFLTLNPDIILDTSNDPTINALLEQQNGKITVLSGTVIDLLARLVKENEKLFQALRQRHREVEAIINSTHDGMLAVNQAGEITIFNRAAERLLGLKAKDVLGKNVNQMIPYTRLDVVLKNGISDLNKKLEIPGGRAIVTNRVPVKDRTGKVSGAVSVFRDVSELQHLTEQLTDLEDMKSLLQAIIDSSDDAISVVDAEGKGILINPAYTRLTGLSAEEVIGKPADVDISEGESMHMQVLKTKKPVRGVQLKVGPHRKEVVVNVAPIVINHELKGSVGILHDTSEIKQLYRDLEKARRIIRTLEAKYTFDDIVAVSENMKMAIDLAKQAATTRATVLLRGESGTGKELFAHAIHNASSRKYNQFVRVNCAAISESLLESELFGYEEGAFTGAKRGGKKGLFEEANGGTLFLDEIGELKPSIQAKLLRVLQEKEVTRVGGTKSISVDVRIIAATNVYLEKAIQEKRFREDLYYRLNVVPIHIPPLRLRLDDLYELSIYLIKKLNQEYGRSVEDIAMEALGMLAEYTWPGNVRELENVLGRAIIHMALNEKVIQCIHLPTLELSSSHYRPQKNTRIYDKSLKQILADVEKEYITEVYMDCGKNKTETARRLNISVRSLYYKLEKYGMI